MGGYSLEDGRQFHFVLFEYCLLSLLYLHIVGLPAVAAGDIGGASLGGGGLHDTALILEQFLALFRFRLSGSPIPCVLVSGSIA